MQISKIFTSKTFIIITWILAFLIILFITFSAGVRVGFNKATHNFERRGIVPRFMPHGTGTPSAFMERGEFGETHGAAGSIISVASTSITIKDKNGEDRAIVVDQTTKIKKERKEIDINELKQGDFIVVFGETNDSEQIAPRLIRVMPKIEDRKPIM